MTTKLNQSLDFSKTRGSAPEVNTSSYIGMEKKSNVKEILAESR